MNPSIPIAKPLLGNEELESIREVFQSGVLVQGEKTRQFEKEFARYIGVKHAVALSNGTAALDTALKALHVTSGDEVITPVFSFVASSNCILFQGAKPVFVDINPRTFNIDPVEVAAKITSKTKAIICAHLFGQPADIKALKEVIAGRKIALVEDAAQAHGAEYAGRKVGGIGTVGCFSFYATKNMTTGEGGMITTNDDELARRSRLIIDHGQTGKYRHAILGYNFRMPEVCATIGLVQLRKLDGFNVVRKKNADLLTRGIRRIRGLIPPQIGKGVNHVFYQYVVKVENDFQLDRDGLADYLRKMGIGTAVHYPIPINRQPLYVELGYEKATFPVAEDACKRVLSLPVHPAVTVKDIAYIIDALKKAA